MHHEEVNLEKIFISEFWINFLVIPMSDYLNRWEIVLSIESQENLHKFFFMLSLFIICENNGKPNFNQ